MTLGFDPQKGGYVGTWIGSMTSFLWIYRGTLDRVEKILTLDTEGPNFDDLKSRWLQSDDAKQRGNSDCEDENYLNHEGLPVVLCSRPA